MKNKIFVLVIGVLAVLGFFILKNQIKPEVLSTPEVTNSELTSFVRPHSPSYGNMLARVIVVEWFDPECESCRMIHPMLKKIISDYKDRVYFVLRYMPYHKNSMFAAAALEEAREFGKYDEALDILFEKQPEWGNHHEPRPDLIPEYLSILGIPKSKLNKSYLLEKHSKKIKMDEADGRNVGVRGTPTFFVNGKMLLELGYEPIKQAIETELEKAKSQ